MSDWADKKAGEMAAVLWAEFSFPKSEGFIAAAFRQARLDALEEAAEEVQRVFGKHVVAAAIRDLKEKQP